MDFELLAEKNRLTLTQKSLLTSGSVNVYSVRFKFSPDWDGLDKRCVFRTGYDTGNVIAVELDENGRCVIPWEVLTTADKLLYAGVYGTKGEEIVLPTVWALLGKILQGTYPGEGSGPPTPDAWQQLKDDLARAAEELENIQGYTQSAVESAESAKASETAAEKSAQAAAGSAADATEQATAAGESASQAAQSAKDADAAREDAEKAAKNAAGEVAEQLSGYVQDADAAKKAAQAAQRGAEQARDDAGGSATAAAGSASEALKNAQTAKQYSGNPPIIRNGTWWTWDAEKQQYVDTGSPAKGDLLFPVFDVDPATGELHMYVQDDYKGPEFRLHGGNLEVIRNV